MEFKGTKTEWEIVEHNWREISICSNGKTICKFELNDIEEEGLTEEENAYNIQLIKHSKEMLEMLQKAKVELSRIKGSMMAHPDCTEGSEFDDYTDSAEEIENEIKQLIKQATEL